MEPMVLDAAPAETAHAYAPLPFASVAAASVAEYASEQPTVAVDAAGKYLTHSQLGTWGANLPAFDKRLCSVPTSDITRRGICHGTEGFRRCVAHVTSTSSSQAGTSTDVPRLAAL